MLSPEELLEKNLLASIDAKSAFLKNIASMTVFSEAARRLVKAYKRGGRLYVAGNGGSAADAQHLAAEFVSRLARERAPLPAEAMTVDTSIITAIGNDYGFDEVFARQIAGKMGKEDVFLGITTSGNSKNIIRALEVCRDKNITSIVFTGHDGGAVKDLTDYCIMANGEETGTIQEIHIVLAHSICGYVEASLFD